MSYLFCSHKGLKIENNIIFEQEKKNLSQATKNYGIFYPKTCHQALKNTGLGSRGQKAPDPGSGSAKLDGAMPKSSFAFTIFICHTCEILVAYK
jgi:hypothetical protein